MDIVSRPSAPRIPLPLACRDIRVPLPWTFASVFAGLAFVAWLLRPDFRFMASGSPRATESFQVASFLFVVAVALSAAATVLVVYGIGLLTMERPHALAASLNKKHWGEAKREILLAPGRNSAPPRRWLFLCGLIGLQVMLVFARRLFLPSQYWLWWWASASGFVLGAVAAFEAAHRWRFSRSIFRMLSDFGVIGGTLQGCVILRPGLTPKRGFRVRLRGVETSTSRDGGDLREAVWLDEAVIVAPLPEEGGGCAVPVSFEIPDHCPESGTKGKTYVEWFVEVSANTPIINCRISFKVPVHHRDKPSRRAGARSRSPLTVFEREVDGSHLYDNAGIRMRTLPGGDTEYCFPGRPILALSLVSLVGMAALAWGANALVLLDKDYCYAWLIVPTACILTTARIILHHLPTTRIQTGPVGLILIENWLAFKRRRSFDANDISSVDLYWNTLTDDVLYYDLVLKTASGTKVSLTTLKGKPESRWIMEQMRRELFPPLTSFARRCRELERFAKAELPQVHPWTSAAVEPAGRESLIAK